MRIELITLHNRIPYILHVLFTAAVCVIISVLFSGCGSGTAVPTTVKYKPDKATAADE
jgi:hypothetical protein